MNLKELKNELTEHLKEKLIPFWTGLIDIENGGYYGYMNFDLEIDKFSEKASVLNSRILWFFSSCYNILQEERYLFYAHHAFEFLKNNFWDKEYGGLYWRVDYKGNVVDATKHVYAQAFGIYALSEYYKATNNIEAFNLANEIYLILEQRCKTKNG